MVKRPSTRVPVNEDKRGDPLVAELAYIRDSVEDCGSLTAVGSDATLKMLTEKLGVILGVLRPDEDVGVRRINRVLGMSVERANMQPHGCLFFYQGTTLLTILDLQKSSRYSIPVTEYLPWNKYSLTSVH